MVNESPIVTYVIVALVVLAVFFRLRRSFGRQPVRSARMTLRIVLLSVIAALVSPTALRSPAFGGAALGGLAAGVSLALWGVTHTRFERSGGRSYYIPHTYTGIAVSLLFMGRVAFHFLQAYAITHSAAGGTAPGAPAALRTDLASTVNTPLTLGLLYVLIGYYVCYLGLVLWKSKRFVADEAIDAPAPAGTDAGRALAGGTDSGTPA